MEITNPDVVKAQVEKLMRDDKVSINTSGQGKSALIPDGVRGWSWGAFLLNFIWAINNRVWIGLLTIIPYAGIAVMFLLGLKGREWAWQSRHWESVEKFNRIQRKWSYWGVVSSVITIVLAVIILIFVEKLFLSNLLI